MSRAKNKTYEITVTITVNEAERFPTKKEMVAMIDTVLFSESNLNMITEALDELVRVEGPDGMSDFEMKVT